MIVFDCLFYLFVPYTQFFVVDELVLFITKLHFLFIGLLAAEGSCQATQSSPKLYKREKGLWSIVFLVCCVVVSHLTERLAVRTPEEDRDLDLSDDCFPSSFLSLSWSSLSAVFLVSSDHNDEEVSKQQTTRTTPYDDDTYPCCQESLTMYLRSPSLGRVLHRPRTWCLLVCEGMSACSCQMER